MYTNDQNDKSIRNKHFIIQVFALPLALILGICGLIYLAFHENLLSKTDALLGGFFSFTPAFILYAKNKNKWLKMPEAGYINIKDLPPTYPMNINEPTEYEAEYFDSKKEKIISALSGLALFFVAIWLGLNKTGFILIPIVCGIMGMFMAFTGIKRLLDKKAKLKLAKSGLWTKQLGFIDYNNISNAEFTEETSGRSPQTMLNIFLKGTLFNQAGQPDERLVLTDVLGKEYIEILLESLMSKRKEIMM
jgi:uncharacterized membrane protein